MMSRLAAMILFWLIPVFGIDIHLEKAGGLVFGSGILLFLTGVGLGDRLKSWQVAVFAGTGTFLFALGGTAVIR